MREIQVIFRKSYSQSLSAPLDFQMCSLLKVKEVFFSVNNILKGWIRNMVVDNMNMASLSVKVGQICLYHVYMFGTTGTTIVSQFIVCYVARQWWTLLVYFPLRSYWDLVLNNSCLVINLQIPMRHLCVMKNILTFSKPTVHIFNGILKLLCLTSYK